MGAYESEAGVRDSSEVVIRIDVRRYYMAGGECWWSINDVLLTPGLTIDGQKRRHRAQVSDRRLRQEDRRKLEAAIHATN